MDSQGKKLDIDDAAASTTFINKPGQEVRWWDRKSATLPEFGLVILIFIADWQGIIPFSKTPFLLVVGWISLRARKVSWSSIGLVRYRNWKLTFAAGTACAIALELNQFFVTQPLLARLTGKQPDLSDFSSLTGNIKFLALLLGLTWTLAAFGEEMVYRGYLMNRIADLRGQSRGAWIASLIVVHVMFGLAHSYQGVSGAVVEGISGLLLGLIYLGFGRNLAVPIIAHGITDTVDFVLTYLGKFPGM